MIQGDTIQLRVHFKDFRGKYIDPSNITLTIYDNQKQFIEQMSITDSNRETVGVYFYDYVPANELNEFIFEFAGSHNNKPILARDKVLITFI